MYGSVSKIKVEYLLEVKDGIAARQDPGASSAK